MQYENDEDFLLSAPINEEGSKSSINVSKKDYELFDEIQDFARPSEKFKNRIMPDQKAPSRIVDNTSIISSS